MAARAVFNEIVAVVRDEYDPQIVQADREYQHITGTEEQYPTIYHSVFREQSFQHLQNLYEAMRSRIDWEISQRLMNSGLEVGSLNPEEIFWAVTRDLGRSVTISELQSFMQTNPPQPLELPQPSGPSEGAAAPASWTVAGAENNLTPQAVPGQLEQMAPFELPNTTAGSVTLNDMSQFDFLGPSLAEPGPLNETLPYFDTLDTAQQLPGTAATPCELEDMPPLDLSSVEFSPLQLHDISEFSEIFPAEAASAQLSNQPGRILERLPQEGTREMPIQIEDDPETPGN